MADRLRIPSHGSRAVSGIRPRIGKWSPWRSASYRRSPLRTDISYVVGSRCPCKRSCRRRQDGTGTSSPKGLSRYTFVRHSQFTAIVTAARTYACGEDYVQPSTSDSSAFWLERLVSFYVATGRAADAVAWRNHLQGVRLVETRRKSIDPRPLGIVRPRANLFRTITVKASTK